jgi:hypothetical protein
MNSLQNPENSRDMTPYQYVISLRIWHPTITREAISEIVDLSPKYSWTAGTPRFSRKGTLLGGLHQSTYWTAELTSGTISSDPIEVEQALTAQADSLARMAEFFKKVRQEGGKAELFVGLFSKSNIVVDFDPSFMGRLSQAALGLCLDYYPWER